ncbi:MAG: type I polyketide synthase, partial [Chloroflexota bacterium]
MSTATRGTDYQALLAEAYRRVTSLSRQVEALERARTEPIAITGMGCRFPGGASDPLAYWRMLLEGVDGIVELPASRWDAPAFYAAIGAPPDVEPKVYGGFLPEIDGFDPEFFGISPREAAAMDPQQRLFVEVAWEALEDGGILPNDLAGAAAGVFAGVHSQSSDYFWLQVGDPSSVTQYTATGTALSVIAGRLSYLLDLRGPSLAVDTACSSSLVAVHLACQSLRSRESDVALAGGVTLRLLPLFNIATSRMGSWPANHRCKTFDDGADGVISGEGCGVVVLKRVSDALRDGDRIYALIRGSAVNQDGSSLGLTAPNSEAQKVVLRRALANAAVLPEQIGYVEAHGTGTPLGDPIEMEALREVLGAARPNGATCAVGSVKTNFGHLEAAAGIAGIIKTALALHHEAIPPHLHFRRLNRNMSLEGTPFVIPTAALPWRRGEAARFAGVSSFGWSGTNAHLVLQEA